MVIIIYPLDPKKPSWNDIVDRSGDNLLASILCGNMDPRDGSARPLSEVLADPSTT